MVGQESRERRIIHRVRGKVKAAPRGTGLDSLIIEFVSRPDGAVQSFHGAGIFRVLDWFISLCKL